jgi:hypothetical protein
MATSSAPILVLARSLPRSAAAGFAADSAWIVASSLPPPPRSSPPVSSPSPATQLVIASAINHPAQLHRVVVLMESYRREPRASCVVSVEFLSSRPAPPPRAGR